MKKMKSSLFMSTAILATSAASGVFAQSDSRSVDGLDVPEAHGGARIPVTTVGDNLGDHIATEPLQMENFDIEDVDNINMEGSLTGPIMIQMETGGRITGLALTPLSGNEAASKWYVDQAVRGASDNLGNHRAEQNLDMRLFKISNMNHADLARDYDGVNVRTLKNYVRDHGDNLGNHIATLNLKMNGFRIDMNELDQDGNPVPGGAGMIVNLPAPTQDGDAANKKYVDDQISNATGGDGGDGMIDIEGGDGIAEVDNAGDPIVINVDDTVVRTDLEITGGDGIDGGGPLTGDLTFDLDDTVVRTFGNQDIGGQKTFEDNGRFVQKLETGDFNGSSGEGISIFRQNNRNHIQTDGATPLQLGSHNTTAELQSFLTLGGPGWGRNNEVKLKSELIGIEAGDYIEITADEGKSRYQANTFGTYIQHLDDVVKIAAGDFNDPSATSSVLIVKPDGTSTFDSEVSVEDHKIVMLADPVNPQDAVNLRTLQAATGGGDDGGGGAEGDNLGNHIATEDVQMGNNLVRFGDFNLNVNDWRYSYATGSGMVMGQRSRDGANVIVGAPGEKLIISATDDLFDNGARLEMNHDNWDETDRNVSLLSPDTVKMWGAKHARVFSDKKASLEVWENNNMSFFELGSSWRGFPHIAANVPFLIGDNQIRELADPTNATDAVNLRTLQAAISGGMGAGNGDNLGNHTATQNLAMANNRITGLANPTQNTDAATKQSVDQAIAASAVTVTGDQTITGEKTFQSTRTVFRRTASGPTLNIQAGGSGSGNAYLRGPDGSGVLVMAEGNTELVPGIMVPEHRRINTGTGLSGGAQLNGDLTLSVDSSVIRAGVDQSAINGEKVWTGTNQFTNSRLGRTALRAVNTGTAGLAFYCEDTRSSAGCGGNRAWTNHSDERLKTDIVDLEEERGLSAIREMRPVTYLWKNEDMNTEGRSLGLVAQNVAEQFPEVVHESTIAQTVDGEEITDVKTMSYAELVAPLILSVQQLDAQDQAASARIEELSAELASMEERLSALEAAQ